MIQDTLQRLRGTQQTLSTSTTADATIPILLGAEQTEAMTELLRSLDGSAPRKFIGLFGSSGSGKTTLLNDLAREGVPGQRTPQHRRVIYTIVNAATLPSDIAAWQRLIYAVLDKLAQQPGAPATIDDLRVELDELITHEQHNDDSAALAGAAFAHHFRTAFSGIIYSTISLANATFVLAIDHVEKASGENASQLLEASRYFINAQNCATLISADEVALSARLSASGEAGASVLKKWLTHRIELQPSATPQGVRVQPVASKEHPKPIASDIPQPCVQILTGALGSDRYAIGRAGETWRGAMRALARRNADGYDTRITATLIAKLCALKQLSPALFDAARFDAPLVANLERRARTPNPTDTGDAWAETMNHDVRLLALFKAAPTFIGLEPRDIATALRLVHSGDSDDKANSVGSGVAPHPKILVLEPNRPRAVLIGSASTSTSTTANDAVSTNTQPRPSRQAQLTRATTSAPMWTVVSIASGAFILDRVVKLAIQGGALSFGALVQPTPLNAANVVGNSLAIGAELVGVALCALILVFWGTKMNSRARMVAFSLIGGGLIANIFDRVAYGSVMNYLHLGTLPVFNLAHVAMVAGALALGYAILADKPREMDI